MSWVIGGAAGLVVLWLLVAKAAIVLGTEFDRRARIVAAKHYIRDHPKGQEESDEAYRYRLHRAVLETLGLPPLLAVQRWVKTGKLILLPTADQVEDYLRQNVHKPLPDGRLDERITNGQGENIVALLRAVGR